MRNCSDSFSLFSWFGGVRYARVEELPRTPSLSLSLSVFGIIMMNGCWDMARGDNVPHLFFFSGNRPSWVSWWGDLSEALKQMLSQVFLPAPAWETYSGWLGSGRVMPWQETNGLLVLDREAKWESSCLRPLQFASLRIKRECRRSPCDLDSD